MRICRWLETVVAEEEVPPRLVVLVPFGCVLRFVEKKEDPNNLYDCPPGREHLLLRVYSF